MTVTWEQALTECEARLDAAATALAKGTLASVVPFSPSEIDEPLPVALAERAQACATRGEELSERLAAELERIRLELRRLPRMPRAPRENRFEARA
jgi:hypothetical protein